jgi:hypothetical protein
LTFLVRQQERFDGDEEMSGQIAGLTAERCRFGY